jgi:hypothetical protein
MSYLGDASRFFWTNHHQSSVLFSKNSKIAMSIRLRSNSFSEEFQIEKRSKAEDTDDSKSSNEDNDERLQKMSNAIRTVLEVYFRFILL